MAKFKPAKGKREAKTGSRRGLVPCLILILGAILLVNLLFYAMLKSSRP